MKVGLDFKAEIFDPFMYLAVLNIYLFSINV